MEEKALLRQALIPFGDSVLVSSMTDTELLIYQSLLTLSSGYPVVSISIMLPDEVFYCYQLIDPLEFQFAKTEIDNISAQIVNYAVETMTDTPE